MLNLVQAASCIEVHCDTEVTVLPALYLMDAQKQHSPTACLHLLDHAGCVVLRSVRLLC